MARLISTAVRLAKEDLAALKRARAAGFSASELVWKGLRVVASRYYRGRRPPTTRFESTDSRITRREAREVVVALFGPKAQVSLGTVAAMERRTSKALRPAYDEALDAVQTADFVHCDETSWRQSNRLAWLWPAVTPMLKVFRIDKRRNREAFRRLLFGFEGMLV